jgi:hypothetical protein
MDFNNKYLNEIQRYIDSNLIYPHHREKVLELMKKLDDDLKATSFPTTGIVRETDNIGQIPGENRPCVPENLDYDFSDFKKYEKLFTTENTAQLVDYVVSSRSNDLFKNIEKVAADRGRILVFSRGNGERVVDYERGFKDVSTKFITNEFLRSKDIMVNYIHLIITQMEFALTKYKKNKGLKNTDIVFLYKGGNALRSLYLSYIYESPGKAADTIYTAFNQFFSKSDADFQISINVHLEKYDEIYNDMKILSYLILNKIRNLFIIKQTEYFDFNKYDKQYREQLLKETLTKMNNVKVSKDVLTVKTVDGESIAYMHGMKFYKLKFKNLEVLADGEKDVDISDSNVKKVTFSKIERELEKSDKTIRPDLVITVDRSKPTDEQKSEVFVMPKMHLSKYGQARNLRKERNINEYVYKRTKTSDSEYYITINDSILDETRTDLRVQFTLVRMKCNLKGFFRTTDGEYGVMNIPGELIDISIPYKSSTKHVEFYKNNVLPIQKYSYVGKYNIDKKIDFTSYTFSYYIHDLIDILYLEHKYPWYDVKYKKRIVRLMFLGYVDMVKTIRMERIQDVLNQLDIYFSSIYDDTLNKRTTAYTKLSTKEYSELEVLVLVKQTEKYFTESKYKDIEKKKIKELCKYIKDLVSYYTKILTATQTFKGVSNERLHLIHHI